MHTQDKGLHAQSLVTDFDGESEMQDAGSHNRKSGLIASDLVVSLSKFRSVGCEER